MSRRRVSVRAPFVVAPAMLLLALTACSGNGNSGGDSPTNNASNQSTSPSTAEASPGGRVIDEATLRGALITTSALPSGFSAEPEKDDVDEGTAPENDTCFPSFTDVVNRDGATHVSRDFTMPGPEAGSRLFVSVSLTSYPDAARLQSELDDYVSQLRDCPVAVETVKGEENRTLISESPVDIVGSDQQYSFTIDGTNSSITTVTTARSGNNVATVIVSYFGSQPDLSVITTAVQNDITQAQFDNLVDVAG